MSDKKTKKKWFNAAGPLTPAAESGARPVGIRATIVTPTGARLNGQITCWIGPGECELDTGARGVLLETHQRRAAKAAQS